MIDLIKYMEGDGNPLVCGFRLAREAPFSQPNLDTFPSDGNVSGELLKTVLTPDDPYKFSEEERLRLIPTTGVKTT